LVIEKMPAPTPGEKLPLAFDYYLDVLYDEAGDPFCRKKAGLEAIRLGRELGEWERVEQLCVRLQKLFPPLHASLEKRRVEANEKVRGVKAAGNGESNK
jgi:hypothetical protein